MSHKMKQTAFRIPAGLVQDCQEIAKAKDSDLNKEVRKLLKGYRERNKKHLNQPT